MSEVPDYQWRIEEAKNFLQQIHTADLTTTRTAGFAQWYVEDVDRLLTIKEALEAIKDPDDPLILWDKAKADIRVEELEEVANDVMVSLQLLVLEHWDDILIGEDIFLDEDKLKEILLKHASNLGEVLQRNTYDPKEDREG
jgi:hypothetical protein